MSGANHDLSGDGLWRGSGLDRWYHENLFTRRDVQLYFWIDEYTAECARLMLRDTHLLESLAEPRHLDDVFRDLDIADPARPTLRRAVQILCHYGAGTWLDDGRVRLLAPRPLFDLDDIRARALAADPDMESGFTIIDKLREHVVRFAQGQSSAELIRSLVHVEFFLSCPIGRQSSELSGALIREIVARDPRPSWNILEFGAGSMSGARGTLDALSRDELVNRLECFWFTEINPFFVMKASMDLPRRYPLARDYRFLRLDFNQPMADIPDQTLDLAYGVNCLQCAEDLPATLAEIARILKPDGWFLIPQFTRGDDDKPLPYVDLVCEPLPSYWDVQLIEGVRPVHGMPTADTWRKLLADTSVEYMGCFPEPEAGLAWFDDKYFIGVILARKRAS